MIYLGSDHKGFALKEKVKIWLADWKYDFTDLGAASLNPNDDYTVYAEAVAEKIKANPDAFGILICGSGVGVDVVANKFDGVRSSIGKSPDQVKAGRNDDNMNVLVIAADFTKEQDAKDMVKIFLETHFANLKRFNKRLDDIKKIERDRRSTNS
ncbi:ribose 5-phosphate isomerase B [soil metagenome]